MLFHQLVIIACTIYCVLGASNFGSLVSSVESELNDLKSRVDAWSASRGITGALGIQSSVQPLVANVNRLESAAQLASPDDINPAQLRSLVSSIVGVLQSLQNKERDFTATGLRGIVSNDIRNVENPTINIVSSLIKVLQTDCDKLNSVAPLVSQIANAFNSVDRTFGARPMQFPSVPACQKRALYEEPLSAANIAGSAGPQAAIVAPTTPGPHYVISGVFAIEPVETAAAAIAPPCSTATKPEAFSSFDAPLSAKTSIPSIVNASTRVAHSPLSMVSASASSAPGFDQQAVGDDTNALASTNTNNNSLQLSNSSSPKAPELVSPTVGLGFNNNTLLIPMLSNRAASLKMGVFAAGVAVAAAVL